MAELPKLDVVIGNNFGHLPMFIGAEKGYFAKHGVDAKMLVVDTGTDMVNAMHDGRAQIGDRVAAAVHDADVDRDQIDAGSEGGALRAGRRRGLLRDHARRPGRHQHAGRDQAVHPHSHGADPTALEVRWVW